MHEDIGEVGLKPKGCGPAFEPLHTGFGLAHDTIEHVDGLDDIHNEIVAHGVMYWLRYEGGYVPSGQYARHLTLEDIASEWINLYHGIEWHEGFLANAPEEQELDEYREEDLATIMEEGRRAIRNEHGTEGDEFNEDTVESITRHFAGWFRRGVHRAEELYGNVGRDQVQCWFTELDEYFTKIIHPELQEEIEITIKLDLDERTLTTTMGAMCGHCGCWLDDCDGEYPLCEDCEEELN